MLDIGEYLCALMDIDGCLCTLVDIRGYLRTLIDIGAYLFTGIDIFGKKSWASFQNLLLSKRQTRAVVSDKLTIKTFYISSLWSL